MHLLCAPCIEIKIEYYGNLNEKNVTVNTFFCKNVKSLLSSKTATPSKIALVENHEVTNDNTKVSETCNSFFTKAV